jgi:hypothetical protein
MDAEATALSKRVVACFQNLEVEAVGAGDIAFRSALRKCLVQAHAVSSAGKDGGEHKGQKKNHL